MIQISLTWRCHAGVNLHDSNWKILHNSLHLLYLFHPLSLGIRVKAEEQKNRRTEEQKSRRAEEQETGISVKRWSVKQNTMRFYKVLSYQSVAIPSTRFCFLIQRELPIRKVGDESISLSLSKYKNSLLSAQIDGVHSAIAGGISSPAIRSF